MTSKYILTAGGDSQTDTAAIYGVRASRTWVPVAGRRLALSKARSFGISGNTSQQLLDRIDVMLMHETPDVAAIAIGVNDPGASISNAQTTINIQAMLMALKHGATGIGAGLNGPVYVASQTALPSDAIGGQRYVVLADSSTTGGAAATTSTQAATITGAVTADANGNKITVWEFREPLAGEWGWGRVAIRTTAPTVTKRIVCVPPPYRNWTAGGDTLTTPDATNAGVRTAIQAAVNAENVTVSSSPTVIYSDLYTWMRARIAAGTDPDFSAVSYDQTRSWHYVQNNQHYSAYGHHLQGEKVAADIAATWPELVA